MKRKSQLRAIIYEVNKSIIFSLWKNPEDLVISFKQEVNK
jgi:hypothetical protein